MEVRNIIATTDLSCFLNLKDIALKVPNSKYNDLNGRCFGLTLKLENPKATARIFRTGKVVCLGTKTQSELEKAGHEIVRLLAPCSAKFTGFIVNNMVGSCDVRCKLNIEKLYELIGGIYEPELFPALQYCTKNKITLLIFHSGKMVATGAKQKHDLDDAHAFILPLLQKFKK